MKRDKAVIAVLAVFMLILAPCHIVDADTTGEYTSTADFDSGYKDISNGNREVITDSDVVSGANNTPSAGELQLENLYSDKFDVADADAKTWKWGEWSVLPDTGAYSIDIDTTQNDALYTQCGNGADTSYTFRNTTADLTGDFDINITIDIDSGPAAGVWLYRLEFYISNNDRIRIERQYSSGNRIIAYSVVGGVNDNDAFTTSDTSIQLRIKRTGTTVYTYYDTSQTSSWTPLHTKSGFSSSNGQAVVGTYATSAVSSTDGYYRNFTVETGDYASGGYRTAGNWTTPMISPGAGEILNNITIDLNNSWSGVDIDQVDILWASNNSIMSSHTADITTNGTTVLTSVDFDNGFTATASTNFKINITLEGDGNNTPIVQRINYTTVISDATPPEIANVTVTPATQDISGYVNITADITDDTAMGTVNINISYLSGTCWTNNSMTAGTSPEYFTNSTYPMLGWYNFTIWAVDAASNANSSSGSFNITLLAHASAMNVWTLNSTADKVSHWYEGDYLFVDGQITLDTDLSDVRVSVSLVTPTASFLLVWKLYTFTGGTPADLKDDINLGTSITKLLANGPGNYYLSMSVTKPGYLVTETVYEYFTTLDRSYHIVFTQQPTMYSDASLVNESSSFEWGDTAYINSTFYCTGWIWSSISLTVYNSTGSFVRTLANASYDLYENIPFNLTEFNSGFTSNFTCNVTPGVYMLRLMINESAGELTNITHDTFFEISNTTIAISANIITYSDNATSLPSNNFIILENIVINGTIKLNRTVNDINIIIGLYNTSGLMSELLNTTWNFTADTIYSITEINLNIILFWESNQTGNFYIQLEIYSDNNTYNTTITEGFRTALSDVAAETSRAGGDTFFEIDLTPVIDMAKAQTLTIILSVIISIIIVIAVREYNANKRKNKKWNAGNSGHKYKSKYKSRPERL